MADDFNHQVNLLGSNQLSPILDKAVQDVKNFHTANKQCHYLIYK